MSIILVKKGIETAIILNTCATDTTAFAVMKCYVAELNAFLTVRTSERATRLRILPKPTRRDTMLLS